MACTSVPVWATAVHCTQAGTQTTLHCLSTATLQDLLGSIAHLSERQEGLQRQLAQLDGSIAGLAAAIPAANSAAACGSVSLLQPARDTQRPGNGSSGVVPSPSSLTVEARLLPAAPSAAGQHDLPQVAATAPDTAAVLACHQGICRRSLQAHAGTAAADAPPPKQAPWPRVPGCDALLLPAALAGAPAHVGSAAVAAVDEAALEQAMLQLRQLRGMALALRQPAAAGAKRCLACEQQQQAAARHAEAQRLAMAARHAVAAVPVLMC